MEMIVSLVMVYVADFLEEARKALESAALQVPPSPQLQGSRRCRAEGVKCSPTRSSVQTPEYEFSIHHDFIVVRSAA